jgi:hypothetical protein
LGAARSRVVVQRLAERQSDEEDEHEAAREEEAAPHGW